MKNIFSIRQFASAQSGEPSYSDISPEEYLRTMLSFIQDGVLLIARATDDVSIYLADDFSAADYVEKYQIDPFKVDEADLVRKEQAIFAVCMETAEKKYDRATALAAMQSAVENFADEEGLFVENVLNCAQRLERLLELGAPEMIVLNERRRLIEALALNAFAITYEEIDKGDVS